MRRSILPLLGAAIFSALATVVATWPQALHPATTLVFHQDTYFSIWRLAWVAHALANSPLHLFDANIFYPTTGTLAYSDAMLLEGALGAPMFWAGVPPTLVYNILLGLGFAGSGLAMFVLVRHLTGATGPALVSAAAFTQAPYRLEHVMHLELQWTMWIPLTFWALHRTVEEGSKKFGALAGACLWLQVVSCVYYGAFLAIVLVAVVPLLLVVNWRRAVRALPALGVAAVVALVLILPYAWPYIDAAHTLGGRDIRDILKYSARPINYLAASSWSWLWGWTADRWGDTELRLFPGLMVLVLSAASVAHRSKHWVLVYAVAAAVAVGVSFGLNNAIYRWLFERVSMLQGLRASARSAILASAALSVLAGLGAQALLERKRPWRFATIPVLLALMVVDGAVRPIDLVGSEVMQPASVYRIIRSSGPGVVLELPLPNLNRLPGREADYLLWSMQHWHPLVNGYSGYYPRDYVRTLVSMESFTNDTSIARLREHQVRYIVVHEAFFTPEDYSKLLIRMAGRPELRPWGRYKDPIGNVELFVLERQAQ
jgi:hypothetical protein